MHNLRMLAKQIKFETLSFVRNPTSAIFTLAFPFIFIFLGGLDHNKSTYNGHSVRNIQLIVPGVIAYSIFGANFTNLAIRITMLRDNGVLKRVRGTPIPTWLYLAGHIGTSIVISAVLAVVIGAAGNVLYSVHYPWASTLPLILLILLSSMAFSAMALFVSGIIANADSAPAVVQVFALPQFIFGGVFFEIPNKGFWGHAAHALPLAHLSAALKQLYGLGRTAQRFSMNDARVLLMWAVVAAVLASRKFKWESSVGSKRSSRRRRAEITT